MTAQYEEQLQFHWADYLVFAISLLMSLAIGVYYAIKDRKKTDNEEFLMAGRSLSIAPVTASTFATLVSSIGFVADPVEVYYFGMGYIFISIGTCLGVVPIAEVIAPAFHKLELVSAFEYLETTFNPFIRKAASLLQIILMFLFMGMMCYAPSVALAQVSGISIHVGIVITTLVCTVYTTFGGMKAVVWSATIQMVIMFAGIIILCIKSFADLGGLIPAMEIIKTGGRTNQFNMNPNPFVRSGLWASLIGGFFRSFIPLSSTQLAIQRYGTLPTAREVKISMYLIIPMYLFLSVIFLFVGLAMYAHFHVCDPLVAGEVISMDQYVPFLVMKVLGPWPGMPGLFIACIFAASLSTMSSAQNGLAANLLKDMIEPKYLSKKGHPMSERMSFLTAKGLALLVGFIVMGMSFIIIAMGGNLFLLLNKIVGIFAGPICGLFTIALLIKSVRNVKAVIFGFVIAVVINLWIGIGAQIYTFRANILPIGVTGCFTPANETLSNETMSWQTTVAMTTTTLAPPPPPTLYTESSGFVQIYNLSPMYYALIGFALTVIFSFIADRFSKYMAKRKAKKSDDVKYTGVEQNGDDPSWTKEDPKRLSKIPPYTFSKKDVCVQTIQSVPPGAQQDILWVTSQESTM